MWLLCFFYFICFFFFVFFFFLCSFFFFFFFFFSSRRRHTRFDCDWSSDVCSSDLDERLRPEHLLGGHDAHRQAEDDGLGGVLEPLVVHGRDAVSRAVEIGRAHV